MPRELTDIEKDALGMRLQRKAHTMSISPAARDMYLTGMREGISIFVTFLEELQAQEDAQATTTRNHLPT